MSGDIRHTRDAGARHGKPVGSNQRFVWLSCLRAFGVILVLVYHFFPAILPGGFIGVDVFFVFSGYLITSLLIREFMDNGRIGLSAFYLRRLRRLAPAVLVCVLLTLLLSLLISPDYRVQIAQQVAAALSWTTNYYEITAGSSYADILLPHLFVHTWTLAIEVQYYLIWGALLFVLLPLTLRRLEGSKRSLALARKVLLILSCFVAIASYLLMQIFLAAAAAGQDTAALTSLASSASAGAPAATVTPAALGGGGFDPSAVYFNTLTHIYPLMIGSAAGILAGYPRTRLVRWLERLNPRLALVLVVICLSIITLMARLLSFEQPETFNFGILLTALLCAVVIVIGRGMQTRLARRREPRILTWLAEASYSLYLLHWPLLIVFAAWSHALAALLDPGIGAIIILLANCLAILATFICAGLSYRFIEKPFSAGGGGVTHLRNFLRAAPARCLAMIAGAISCAALAAFALITAPPLSSIDTALRQGAAALQATRIEEAHTSLLRLDKVHSDSGAVYIGKGMTGNIVGGSITLIGDSVAVFPSATIAAKTGAYVDVEVGRSMESGVPMILAMQANGELGENVVVALATNTHAGSFAAARELCEQIAPGHRLIFVTAHGIGYGDMAALSAELRTLPAEFPFVSIADWDQAIASHEEWLAADGYHCAAPESIDLWAKVVLAALDAQHNKPLSGSAHV